MAPIRIEPQNAWSMAAPAAESEAYNGPPRNLAAINALDFDESLRPEHYEILGTHPESKILFLDFSILDSTGQAPYRGDALVQGSPIAI